ncbi:MAG: Zn-dependent M28 family amino/carboxypeptidase [Candidatus Krumholzibacteriia bacterium]|jgi:Zn-dependent M28 family amino/carboxypeptidase
MLGSRSRPIFIIQLAIAFTLVAHLAPKSVFGVGITYAPDTLLSDVHSDRPNLSVLTFEVPGGLIIADRISQGGESAYGNAFQPQFKNSEFYLIQSKGHRHDPVQTEQQLTSLGHIHWRQDASFVVEVSAANQSAFAATDLDRVRIPLEAPPVGWDQLHPLASNSSFTNKDAALIADFVANVSQPAFFQTVQEISGHAVFSYNGSQSVNTRYYNTTDKTLIGDYMADKLTGYGYTVEFDNFTYNGVPCRNIVATKTGTVAPNEFVVVGGHYDSISPSPSNNAPGAEDNGSGTASVMEIARIAAGRDFEKSIQFVLFDSEEQGLNGSVHFVNEAISENRNIIAAVTMDMIAWNDGTAGTYKVRIEGQPAWESLMSVMENNTNLLTDIANQKDYFSFGSDHVPFQQAGIPAFLAIEYDYDNYPGYHRTTDEWTLISGVAGLGTQITIACAATLAEVAVLQDDQSGVGDLPQYGPIDLVAFPNPFNPQVTVSFSPEKDIEGEVAVYDLSGKQIAVVATGTFLRGQNVVQWNGTDASGREVSSGVYVFRMKAGDKTSSVAVSLVK